jgi:GTP pyrophosphokinase
MNSLSNEAERLDFFKTYRCLMENTEESILSEDKEKVKKYVREALKKEGYGKDIYGQNILLRTIHTALIVSDEIGLKRSSILAVLLSQLIFAGFCKIPEIEKDFGKDVADIICGLIKTHKLYEKNAAIDNEISALYFYLLPKMFASF